MEALRNVCWGMIKGVFTITGGLTDMLKFSSSDKLFQNVINAVWDSIQIVAITLLIVYFVLYMNKVLLSRGETGLKDLIMSLLKLIIGIYLVANGKDLMTYLFSFNNTFIDKMNEACKVSGAVLSDGQMETLKDAIVGDWGIFDCIAGMLMFVIVFLAQALATLMLWYHAISRKLELGVRVAFAPIAMGDVFDDGNSTALRYIKKLVAIFILGGALIVVVNIGTSLSLGYIVEVFSGKAAAVGEITSASSLSAMVEGAGKLAEAGIVDLVMALLKAVLFPLAEAGLYSTLKTICYDAMGVS